MKRFVLIKQSHMVDVAHLYEHLYCMAITRFLVGKTLFQYVDYSLVGKTSHSGIVSIDLELYSDDAISMVQNLTALKISTARKDVLNALTQLLAEEEKLPISGGFDVLKRELRSIDDNKWESIDDLDMLDMSSGRKHEGSLSISSEELRPAEVLSIGVVIKRDFIKDNRDILPLFHEFSRLVIDNLQITIPNLFGYYSFRDSFSHDKKFIGLINDFRVPNTESITPDTSEVLRAAQEIAKDLVTGGAFERHLTILQELSFFNSPNLTPNFETVYNDTRILTGARGWKRIATRTNMQDILDHMQLEVEFESQRLIKPLLASLNER